MSGSKEIKVEDLAYGLDVAWILMCSALVVVMQVGFAYVEAGSIRVKNVRSILLKNAVDYVIGGLAYIIISHGIATGKSVGGFVGTSEYFSIPSDPDVNMGYHYAIVLFTALFACTTSTIISGAIAERLKLSAYICLSSMSPIFLFGFPAHWVWNSEGWLNGGMYDKLIVSDFAGGAVVHVSGGIAGLVAAWFVGPRIGRFRVKDGRPRDIPGHSVVLSGLGTWLIVFGWLGFNAGSSFGVSTPDTAYKASLAAINTFAGILMGALVGLMVDFFVFGKMKLDNMFNSMLAGAASITAGAGLVPLWSTPIISCLGTIAYLLVNHTLVSRFRIDDPLGAVGVHAGGGSVGFLLVGVFHLERGLVFTGEGWALVSQIVGLLVICLNAIFWVALTLIVYTFVAGPCRVEENIEVRGCDVELDGIAAYQDSEEDVVKFSVIRQNRKLYEEFRKYLESIYCQQNVEFVEAVENYEKGLGDHSVDSKMEAQIVYDSYLCPDGACPVNVPEWQQQQCKKIIEQLNSEELEDSAPTSKNSSKHSIPPPARSARQDNTLSEASLLKGLFTLAKAEVVTLLNNTIQVHFRHTPQYSVFNKKLKTSASGKCHALTKMWCCTQGPKMAYGRARPFDPRKKFMHNEEISDGDTDSDDDADWSVRRSQVAPGEDV